MHNRFTPLPFAGVAGNVCSDRCDCALFVQTREKSQHSHLCRCDKLPIWVRGKRFARIHAATVHAERQQTGTTAAAATAATAAAAASDDGGGGGVQSKHGACRFNLAETATGAE